MKTWIWLYSFELVDYTMYLVIIQCISYFFSLPSWSSTTSCKEHTHFETLFRMFQKPGMAYVLYKLLYHSWNINTIIANIPGLSSAPFLHLWLMRSIVNVSNLVHRCLSFQKCDWIKWFYIALYHISINIHKLWIRQSLFFLCRAFLLLWLYTFLIECSVETRTRFMKANRIQ